MSGLVETPVVSRMPSSRAVLPLPTSVTVRLPPPGASSCRVMPLPLIEAVTVRPAGGLASIIRSTSPTVTARLTSDDGRIRAVGDAKGAAGANAAAAEESAQRGVLGELRIEVDSAQNFAGDAAEHVDARGVGAEQHAEVGVAAQLAIVAVVLDLRSINRIRLDVGLRPGEQVAAAELGVGGTKQLFEGAIDFADGLIADGLRAGGAGGADGETRISPSSVATPSRATSVACR